MRLDAAARRFFPGFILLLLGTAAYFQALGAGHIVAAAVMPAPGDPAPAGPKAAVALPADPRARSAAAVIARNPFDSVTGPLDGALLPEGPTPPGDDVANRDPYSDPLCGGAKVLAIVAADDAPWSFASIAGAGGKPVLRRQGDTVDGRTVAFVGDWRSEDRRREDRRDVWDRVWLTEGGARCQMQLGREAPVAFTPPPPAAATAKNQLPPDIAAGIRRIGPNEIEVDRGVIDQIIARQADLVKLRVVPEKEGDRVVGARLHGIRPGSLPSVLGIENGDLVRSVNGIAMTDPRSALSLYAQLPTARQFTVVLDRKGAPAQIEVRVK